MHRTLDFGPDQPGRNQMYQSFRVALRSYCLSYILYSSAYVSVRFSGNYYTTLLPGPTSSFHTRYKTKFRKKVPFYVAY